MLRLIIGSKSYSSWSLRAWLGMKLSGLPFDEEVIPLKQEDTRERILRYSPSGKVPCLMDGSLAIWESLAILEYAAELAPDAGLWPKDRVARAVARSISSEMHAGFLPLRRNMPMNMKERRPGRGRGEGEEAAAVEADIRRIERLWTQARVDYGAGGDFLFGHFSAADCMFAPVVSRFHTYDVKLNPAAHAYVEAVLEHPFMKEWVAGAVAEPWVVEAYRV